jgi:hypothetical protein
MVIRQACVVGGALALSTQFAGVAPTAIAGGSSTHSPSRLATSIIVRALPSTDTTAASSSFGS